MENSIDAIQPQNPRPRGRWWLWAILVTVALVVVACVGGQALVPQDGAGGGNILELGGAPDGKNQTIRRERPSLIPAPGLPAGEPDVAGLYQRREDQSIFIGTGEVKVMVAIQEGAAPSTNASSDGPVVEVVVTRNTQIFKDVTEIDLASETNEPIQQVVEAVDSLDSLLEEVNTTDTLTVWGRQSGDRVIADVLVYQSLQLPSAPMR